MPFTWMGLEYDPPNYKTRTHLRLLGRVSKSDIDWKTSFNTFRNRFFDENLVNLQ